MLIVAATINILLLNHEFSDLKVQSVALRSHEFHKLCCIAACICDICDICVTLNRVWRCILCDILKYSTCMLIVEATINMPETPCTSWFAVCHVNRLIVFANFFIRIQDSITSI